MPTTIFEELDKLKDIFLQDVKHISNSEFKGHCLTCNEPIVGKVTSFTQNELKSNFHLACFKCASCSSSMDGKGFYLHEGKFLDQECYHKMVLGNCDGCQKTFSDATVVKAGGKQYHPACFTCNACQDTLSGSYVEKDGRIVCKSCYEKQYLPPCYSCKKPIAPEQGTNKLMAIEWKDKKFHIACFACKMCSQPFSDLKAVLHKDDLLCKICFEKISKV